MKRKIGAVLVALTLALGIGVIAAPAASAASNLCGTNYVQTAVVYTDIGFDGSYAKTVVYYNSSNHYACAVNIVVENWGSPLYGIKVNLNNAVTGAQVCDPVNCANFGAYHSYAGPVYSYSPTNCVWVIGGYLDSAGNPAFRERTTFIPPRANC